MTISRRRLIPYSEVRFDWLGAPNTFALEAPWLRLTGEVSPDIFKRFSAAVSRWPNIKDDDPEVPLISSFLEQLGAAPVAFILPNEKPMPAAIIAQWKVPPIPQSLKVQGRGDYLWPIEATLEMARLSGGDRYDPVTLYTALRRLCLLSTIDRPANEVFAGELTRLAKVDEARFAKAAQVIVRRAHYLTVAASAILGKAEASFPAAAVLLGGYRRSEVGHDGLLAESLEHLGARPDDVPVVESEVALIEMLNFGASSDPLIFSSMIGLLEGVAFTNSTSPLARLMEGTTRYAPAARGLIRHLEINRVGDHASVGLQLAEMIAPIAADVAVAAIKAVEFFCGLELESSRETMKLALAR